jgi:CRISPR-associated protein Cas1
MAQVDHLLVSEFGSFLSKHGGRLRLSKGEEVLIEAPYRFLQSVLILNHGVGLSSDVIHLCGEAGIPIFIMDSHGLPLEMLYSAGLVGMAITRRHQYRAYEDERGVALVLALAAAKIRNQTTTLKYLGKNRQEQVDLYRGLQAAIPELQSAHDKLLAFDEGAPLDDLRPHIMAYEAQAALHYWAALRPLVPASYGWERRETWGATDPINMCLNYTYAILYGRVQQALMLAGLDPFAGFLHVDRPGRLSLVYDLAEEFRADVVDRVIIGLAARRFEVKRDAEGRLDGDTRKTLARHIIDHLDGGVRYEGQRRALKHVIQSQAYKLAAFLRRETPQYEAYSATW